MAKASTTIKTIITPNRESFAGFLPDKENEIDFKVVPVVCWSLLAFDNGDPDEVIGQIVAGDAILEVTYVDEDEGFGKFLGYFYSEEAARVSILAAVAEGDIEDEDFSSVESDEDLDESDGDEGPPVDLSDEDDEDEEEDDEDEYADDEEEEEDDEEEDDD